MYGNDSLYNFLMPFSKERNDEEFFSENFDLEKFISEFVDSAGGFRVSEYFEIPPGLDNPDYYFPNENVLIELKVLKTQWSQRPKFRNERARIINNWISKGRVAPVWLTGKAISPDLDLEIMKVLRNCLQPISQKANKQIRTTKDYFGISKARGLLVVINDGFYDSPPLETLHLLSDPLVRHFHSIGAVVHFNVRRQVVLSNDELALFWLARYRAPVDEGLGDFVNFLGQRWWIYLEERSGVKFQNYTVDYDPQHTFLFGSRYKPDPGV